MGAVDHLVFESLFEGRGQDQVATWCQDACQFVKHTVRIFGGQVFDHFRAEDRII